MKQAENISNCSTVSKIPTNDGADEIENLTIPGEKMFQKIGLSSALLIIIIGIVLSYELAKFNHNLIVLFIVFILLLFLNLYYFLHKFVSYIGRNRFILSVLFVWISFWILIFGDIGLFLVLPFIGGFIFFLLVLLILNFDQKTETFAKKRKDHTGEGDHLNGKLNQQ